MGASRVGEPGRRARRDAGDRALGGLDRGTVTIFAGRTKITMNQDGDVTVEGAADMTFKATGDLKLEARNVKIESQLNTEIEAGMRGSFKAKLGTTVDGGLSGTLKGATVAINGITSFSPA